MPVLFRGGAYKFSRQSPGAGGELLRRHVAATTVDLLLFLMILFYDLQLSLSDDKEVSELNV